MKLIHYLILLNNYTFLAMASPKPARGTESGGGIAPWAGSGPDPPPRDTSRVANPFALAESSSVPLGTIITSCTVPGTVALTFDDGPYIYTNQVLDLLRNNNIHATFFLNGNNWQSILTDDSKALVQRMVAEGHQIGSHTYGPLLPFLIAYRFLIMTIYLTRFTLILETAGLTPTLQPSTMTVS